MKTKFFNGKHLVSKENLLMLQNNTVGVSGLKQVRLMELATQELILMILKFHHTQETINIESNKQIIQESQEFHHLRISLLTLLQFQSLILELKITQSLQQKPCMKFMIHMVIQLRKVTGKTLESPTLKKGFIILTTILKQEKQLIRNNFQRKRINILLIRGIFFTSK